MIKIIANFDFFETFKKFRIQRIYMLVIIISFIATKNFLRYKIKIHKNFGNNEKIMKNKDSVGKPIKKGI